LAVNGIQKASIAGVLRSGWSVMGRFSGIGRRDQGTPQGDTFADRATSPFLDAAKPLQERGREWQRCGIRNT
jgi:hypothetical protein